MKLKQAEIALIQRLAEKVRRAKLTGTNPVEVGVRDLEAAVNLIERLAAARSGE